MRELLHAEDLHRIHNDAMARIGEHASNPNTAWASVGICGDCMIAHANGSIATNLNDQIGQRPLEEMAPEEIERAMSRAHATGVLLGLEIARRRK